VVPDKNKKSFLVTWLTSLDSSFRSVSGIKKEASLKLRDQKYEYYEGTINYTDGHPQTNHNRRYFTTLITSKGKYIYFIDIRYNEADRKTLVTRDSIFRSIIIK
jgi:hypothetical protein